MLLSVNIQHRHWTKYHTTWSLLIIISKIVLLQRRIKYVVFRLDVTNYFCNRWLCSGKKELKYISKPPEKRHDLLCDRQEWMIISENTMRSMHTPFPPNALSTLANRLRRWPNIERAIGEFPVFVWDRDNQYGQEFDTIADLRNRPYSYMYEQGIPIDSLIRGFRVLNWT